MAPDFGCDTTGLAFVTMQEYLVTYGLTFVFFILYVVPLGYISLIFYGTYFTSISSLAFLQKHFASGTLFSDCTGQTGLRTFSGTQAKITKGKMDQQPLQSTLPPKDEYFKETQPRQMLVIEDGSSLLAPLTIDEPECKETLLLTERPEPTAEAIPEGDTLVSQVTPLLGTTP